MRAERLGSVRTRAVDRTSAKGKCEAVALNFHENFFINVCKTSFPCMDKRQSSQSDRISVVLKGGKEIVAIVK